MSMDAAGMYRCAETVTRVMAVLPRDTTFDQWFDLWHTGTDVEALAILAIAATICEKPEWLALIQGQICKFQKLVTLFRPV